MSKRNNNIMNKNQKEKCFIMSFIIYTDAESSLKKISSGEKNPEKSSTKKVTQHTPCGYSLFKHRSFDINKNINNFYIGADCMKKFCADLKNHATKIIASKKHNTIDKENKKKYKK